MVFGLRRVGHDERLARFEASLEATDVLPFDDEAGRLAGRINADLERRGRIIGLPDVMIAAIALRNDLPVVTGNASHFERVCGAGSALVIDNWKVVPG